MAADDGVKRKPQKKNENNAQDDSEDGEAAEENFSDPEGYNDDITEEELLGDLLAQKPHENDNYDSLIVVDNIPQVGPERLDKLKNVISKIFQKFGDIVSVHYPMEDNKTKGYMFLEYSHPDHAVEAVKTTNGYKLDKQHTFVVNLFSDFDRYTGVPEEWEPPKPQPYKDVGNLRHWLLNKDCHDLFSVIYEGGEKTMIVLNAAPEPLIVQERPRWTETYVKWSPQGTYLATMHQKGIALWGGEQFKQIVRFNHPGVQLIDFSPCERFVVTFSPMVTSKDSQESVIVWDMRSGLKRRGFQCDSSSGWPVFRWSADGQYFARMTPDTLSIYETPSCGLLEKKSLKLDGIRDFAWSPTSNVIAYWIPEADHNPARVVLLEVPSRTELRVRNLFNVADCKLHWQKSGDFLCVKVDRYSKMKKDEKNEQLKYAGVYYNFELFHVREKGIPVDTVECKETVSAFAWEPIGSKFAYIHGESQRINVSFYQITGDKVSLIKTLDKRQCNSIFWCPTGQFVVLAGLRSMNGTLEFVDTSDMTVMSPNPCEHFMASDIEWDPTGRYVTTAVSWWAHKVDNAYWIWNFQGRLMGKHSLDKFCQFLWRPRPPALLNEKMIKDIKKNMKKYSTQFDIQDRMMLSKASKELVEKRRRLMDEFEKFRAQVREVFSNQKGQRMALRKGIDTDELDSHVENFEEETIEFLVKFEETIEERE